MKELQKTKIGIGKNMPEQNKSGTDETKNKTVKMAVDELMQRNQALEEENKTLKAENDELKTNLTEATTFLDAQVRAKLGGELQKISRFTVEDIDGMETDDLAATVRTLSHASNATKKPMIAGETETKDPRLTVGSLFAQPLRSKSEAS